MRDIEQDIADDFELSGDEQPTVRELYERALTRRGFEADPAQAAAVDQLQRIAQDWVAYKNRRRKALLRLHARRAP